MFKELLYTARGFIVGVIDIKGTSPYRYGSALLSTDKEWFGHCAYIAGRHISRTFSRRTQ